MAKLERIKLMLQSILNTFNSLQTDKGTLTFPDEQIAEGISVMILDEEGNETVPADGEYYLGDEDRRTLVIENGVVKEIIMPEVEIVEEIAEEAETIEAETEEENAEENGPEDVAEEIVNEVEDVVDEVADNIPDANDELRAKIEELQALIDELKSRIEVLEAKPADEPADKRFKKQVRTTNADKFSNLKNILS